MAYTTSSWGGSKADSPPPAATGLAASVVVCCAALFPACSPTDSSSNHVTNHPSSTLAPVPTDATEAASDDGGNVPYAESGGADANATVRLPTLTARPGVINDITFDDLQLDIPLQTLFDRSMLTVRAGQLEKKSVRIRGFIFAGGVFQQTGITSFPLVKNTECKFGPQGLAYCVILVDLADGVKTNFTTRPVTVEGTLSVRPFNLDGFTWSVYHIRGQRVY